MIILMKRMAMIILMVMAMKMTTANAKAAAMQLTMISSRSRWGHCRLVKWKALEAKAKPNYEK